MRKQAGLNGFDVAVGYDDEYGVYAIYAGRDGLTSDDEVEIESTPEPDQGALALTDE
jgi:hypothetical protein